jgi:hypothetical protein
MSDLLNQRATAIARKTLIIGDFSHVAFAPEWIQDQLRPPTGEA